MEYFVLVEIDRGIMVAVSEKIRESFPNYSEITVGELAATKCLREVPSSGVYTKPALGH